MLRQTLPAGDIRGGAGPAEEAVRLAPELPELHFALARAYAKAGRAEDAARERATFAELDQKRREKQAAEAASRPVGGQP